MTKQSDSLEQLQQLALIRADIRQTTQSGALALKNRLQPGNLAQEAKSKALRQVKAGGRVVAVKAKNNKGIVIAAAGTVTAAAALIVMRKPLMNWLAARKNSVNHMSGNVESTSPDQAIDSAKHPGIES